MSQCYAFILLDWTCSNKVKRKEYSTTSYLLFGQMASYISSKNELKPLFVFHISVFHITIPVQSCYFQQSLWTSSFHGLRQFFLETHPGCSSFIKFLVKILSFSYRATHIQFCGTARDIMIYVSNSMIFKPLSILSGMVCMHFNYRYYTTKQTE